MLQTPIFQSKQAMHISLNSQFIVVLDDMICFSVRFCDKNAKSVKNAFSGLYFCKQKGTRVFRWQEDINVVVISALSSTKSCLSFLKFSFLAGVFKKNFIMSLKSTLFPKEVWDTIL